MYNSTHFRFDCFAVRSDLLTVFDAGDGEGVCPQLDQEEVKEQEEEETGPQTSLPNWCHKRKAREWIEQVGECVLQVQCHSFKQSLLSSCSHGFPTYLIIQSAGKAMACCALNSGCMWGSAFMRHAIDSFVQTAFSHATHACSTCVSCCRCSAAAGS